MNLAAERSRVRGIFVEEQNHFWELPRENTSARREQVLTFIRASYATDLIVVHAHHDLKLHRGTRPRIRPNHPHVTIGLERYVQGNLFSQIDEFLELHHTLHWLNVREHDGVGLAVVGLIMEGAEKLKLPNEHPNSLRKLDPGYSACFCHRGVWVMRRDDLSDPNSRWKTHFVLSGLPVDGQNYTPKITPENKENYEAWSASGQWPASLPRVKQFYDAPVEDQQGSHDPATEELLGWEVVINGL